MNLKRTGTGKSKIKKSEKQAFQQLAQSMEKITSFAHEFLILPDIFNVQLSSEPMEDNKDNTVYIGFIEKEAGELTLVISDELLKPNSQDEMPLYFLIFRQLRYIHQEYGQYCLEEYGEKQWLRSFTKSFSLREKVEIEGPLPVNMGPWIWSQQVHHKPDHYYVSGEDVDADAYALCMIKLMFLNEEYDWSSLPLNTKEAALQRAEGLFAGDPRLMKYMKKHPEACKGLNLPIPDEIPKEAEKLADALEKAADEDRTSQSRSLSDWEAELINNSYQRYSFEDKTYIRAEKKVGRNDPCPCGSGKKYKKCCGRNR